ncbi:hypothetical protein CGRA01v4_03849 [Colletotrichum graminicola]|nr:hypothetical protein CGRA01v4_03849 [Colletotrichum graminicola]
MARRVASIEAPPFLPLPVPRSSVSVADHAGLVGARSLPSCRNSNHPSCGCIRASGFSCSRTHQGAKGCRSPPHPFNPYEALGSSFPSLGTFLPPLVDSPAPSHSGSRRPSHVACSTKLCLQAHPCGRAPLLSLSSRHTIWEINSSPASLYNITTSTSAPTYYILVAGRSMQLRHLPC